MLPDLLHDRSPPRRPRHLPHPHAGQGPERDGRLRRQHARDPRRRAGDRRHRLLPRPGALARHGHLRRRPRRRPLGVHLPRRPRPHRQPRRHPRPLPAGDPRRQLGDDRPPHGRRGAAAAPHALARPGRGLRRRRPHAPPRAPAAVRLARHPRPVRSHHRRAVGRRHLRRHGAGRGPRGRRRRPRPLRRHLRRHEHLEHAVARVGRHRRASPPTSQTTADAAAARRWPAPTGPILRGDRIADAFARTLGPRRPAGAAHPRPEHARRAPRRLRHRRRRRPEPTTDATRHTKETERWERCRRPTR